MAKRGAGKAKIILAAQQLLLDHGRAGLRIDDVAQAAGINKRMIYHYFGDREGLIATVLSLALAHMQQDARTSDELKLLLSDIYSDLGVPDQTEPLENVSDAMRLLLTDAVIDSAKRESKYSLTRSGQRRVALEIAGYLFPKHFEPPAQKPVYRLQSESKPVGSKVS